jgi:hypothetical protein
MPSEMNGLALAPRGLKQSKRYFAENISALLSSGSTAATTKHSATEKVSECFEDIGDVIELMLATATTAILQTCVAEPVVSTP